MTKLSKDIIDRITFIALRLLPEETNWLVVKRQLLFTLTSEDRGFLTRRDEKTKLHFPFNDFENAIRSLWENLTGNKLQMPIEKRLDPFDEIGYL